jgi:hypothetical protein
MTDETTCHECSRCREAGCFAYHPPVKRKVEYVRIDILHIYIKYIGCDHYKVIHDLDEDVTVN